MKRKQKDPNVRSYVYKYGCLAPSKEDEKRICEQIRLGCKYRNDLVDLERKRAALSKATTFGIDSELEALCEQRDELSARIKDLRDELSLRRQKERKKVNDPEVRAEIAQLDALRKAVQARIKECRTRLGTLPDVVWKREYVNEQAHRRQLALRAQWVRNGLYHGTYGIIDDAVKAAKSARTKVSRPVPQRWHEFGRFQSSTGEGAVGVQIPNGMSVAELFAGTHTQAQVDPVSADAWSTRSGRRRNTRTTLRLRMGSVEGRKPLWVEFPIVLHRPLPANATVKRVKVRRFRVGPTWRYEALFTLSDNTVSTERVDTRVAGIDIGWRMLGDNYSDGMRVAMLYDGVQFFELVLPALLIGKLRHTEHLQGIRDAEFNTIKQRLSAFISECGAVPEWLVIECAHISKWRTQRRLMRLMRVWEQQRFVEDAEMWQVLTVWAERDTHLWSWEVNERRRALGWRREIYRLWAARVTSTYAHVGIEKLNLRAFSVAPEVENDVAGGSKWGRKTAALSELRNELRVAAQKRSARIIEVPAAYTSSTCHACSTRSSIDAGVAQKCGNCGVKWDRDQNAAKNIRARCLILAENNEIAALSSVSSAANRAI